MFNSDTHSNHEKENRILSEEDRDRRYRISSIIRYGFIGAFFSLSLFTILNLYNPGVNSVWSSEIVIDPEAAWAIFGGIIGCLIGKVIVDISTR